MCLLVVRLSLFYLSFLKIPKEVNSTLEGIQRIFLWGANHDNKKDCWGEMRHDLQKQKNERIRGKFFFDKFNEALLGKPRWYLFHCDEGLWWEVLASIYGDWHNILREGNSTM